jgi:hypothetical protein
VLALLGLALVVVGVLLWGSDPAEFGWFSYGPVDEEFLSQLVFMSSRRWVGVACLVSGMTSLAGVLGFHLGTRRGRVPAG